MSDITNAGAIAAAVALQATTLGASAYIGVGDSNTAFTPAQTDLQAATNKLRKQVTVSAVAGNVVQLTTSFITSEANFAWNEVGVFTAGNGGTMHVRKVVGLPTKTSSETWTIEVDVAYSAG
jgi:hypothetical protein